MANDPRHDEENRKWKEEQKKKKERQSNDNKTNNWRQGDSRNKRMDRKAAIRQIVQQNDKIMEGVTKYFQETNKNLAALSKGDSSDDEEDSDKDF